MSEGGSTRGMTGAQKGGREYKREEGRKGLREGGREYKREEGSTRGSTRRKEGVHEGVQEGRREYKTEEVSTRGKEGTQDVLRQQPHVMHLGSFPSCTRNKLSCSYNDIFSKYGFQNLVLPFGLR